MKPRISILLPVYDAQATLESCLRSIARQRVRDWECVIVDDGSRDASLDIARAAARRDGRFRVIGRPHEGLVTSLNAGLAECQGEFVARMDADDWMHRDRLALQVDRLERDEGLDAIGSFVRIFPRQTLRDGRRRYESWLHALADPASLWRDRFIECPVAHPTLMMRRNVLHEVGYRDRGWPEDYDLLLRLLRRGPRVAVVPRRLLGWRDHPERLSRNDLRYSLAQFTRCRAWHLSRDFLSGSSRYILWGHGRTGRALRKALAALGHQPSAIVDVHPRRIGQMIHAAPVIPLAALPTHPRQPLIVSVAGAGPRAEIRDALAAMSFQDGRDFVCAA